MRLAAADNGLLRGEVGYCCESGLDVQRKLYSAVGPPGETNLKKSASLDAESTIKIYLRHEVVSKLTTRIVEVNGLAVVHESYITEAGGSRGSEKNGGETAETKLFVPRIGETATKDLTLAGFRVIEQATCTASLTSASTKKKHAGQWISANKD
jgi:hypothetical protein